ncbi:MAG: hypothetical protein OEY78_02900 [Gammaproteobacteria bacterium]|nr:hypothetical protein [Gammaproteobacteria bacterium]
MPDQQDENIMVLGTRYLPRNARIQYSEPLWKRVPTRDLKGKPYTDFMMLIPGLRNFELSRLQEIIDKIERVLKHYEKDIILADLNLKINVLWVTLQPRVGLSSEIAALIHHLVPEAKLVSQHTAQV